jgi:hypothetical protein
MTKIPNWGRYATLHRIDGREEGLLENFKALRSGTLADLVGMVASLPENERKLYFIEKEGERRIDAGEIMDLYRRDDYPR